MAVTNHSEQRPRGGLNCHAPLNGKTCVERNVNSPCVYCRSWSSLAVEIRQRDALNVVNAAIKWRYSTYTSLPESKRLARIIDLYIEKHGPDVERPVAVVNPPDPELCLGCHAETDLDDDGYCLDCNDEHAEDNGE